MKSKEFVRKVLVPSGARFLKVRGDHHVYLLPNGRKFDVPIGGSQTELSGYMESKFRSAMRGRR
jgi:predicted RNA binding protein YcfA (HicA-like mRNA interferase family)